MIITKKAKPSNKNLETQNNVKEKRKPKNKNDLKPKRKIKSRQ